MNKTIKKFLIFAISFLFITGISVNVFAESLKSASNLFYADETINESFDEEEKVSDVYAAGNSITLDGYVTGDIIAAGNTIDINLQNIDGNLRAAGAKINVISQVAKNVTVAGGVINFKEGSYAKGVYIMGGDITFDGTAEDLFISGETVKINGTVTGNVDVNCSELILGENAKIDGNIKVKAPNEPNILGNIDSSKIDFIKVVTNKENDFSFAGISIAGKVIGIITSIILVALLTLLCKKFIRKSTERLKAKPWLPFVIGFATLIIVPIAGIMICITVVGIPVSVLALIMYGVLIYLAPVISGAIAGRMVFKGMNVYLSAIICTAIIKVVMIIPYLGGILMFACILLSLGVFIENIFGVASEKELV